MKKVSTRRLAESAVFIAIATVLSLYKIDLPFGGGVTIVSMLPLVLLSHRYGWRWGLFSAFVYSVLQLLLGMDNVAYASGFLSGAAIVLLDYLLAYTVIGLSALTEKFLGRTRNAVIVGIFATFFARFLCHLITGAVIWDAWMPEEFMGLTMTNPWQYSLLYNGWYMLFELLLTELVVFFLYPALGRFFRADDLKG